MAELDMPTISWRKSSRCGESGACVEVARLEKSVAVRDSKHHAGPTLYFDRHRWMEFVEGIRVGEFKR
jgi:hypothetical protein